MSLDRRTFLRSTAALGLAAGAAGGDPDPLPRRTLGKTGVQVSILGFGTAYVRKSGADEVGRMADLLLDAGVNYVDTASSYSTAEEKLGPVVARRRKDMFLATKILERKAGDAQSELERSLRRLRTDHVDLLQIHAICKAGDLAAITAKGGSLEALAAAKKDGKARFVGITGHTDPKVLADAFDVFDFDTVLLPVSPPDALLGDMEAGAIPKARGKNMGVIAMKVFAIGKNPERQAAFDYALSGDVDLAIIGLDTEEQARDTLGIARKFRRLSAEERAEVRERSKPLAKPSVLWWKG